MDLNHLRHTRIQKHQLGQFIKFAEKKYSQHTVQLKVVVDVNTAKLVELTCLLQHFFT